MNNKKAQVGIVGAIILFLIFLVMWFVWLGAWLGNIGQSIVIANGLSGIEAFFLSNLNFIVLICMLLGMMGWMYFGSGE